MNISSFFKTKFLGFMFIFSSFLLLEPINLYSQDAAVDTCHRTEIQACQSEFKSWNAISISNPPLYAKAQTCVSQLIAAYNQCQNASNLAQNAATAGLVTNATTTTSNLADAAGGMAVSGSQAASAGPIYSQCGETANTAKSFCTATGMVSCTQYQLHLSSTCPQLAKSSYIAAEKTGQIAKAASTLKPLLLGAAIGAGAMALMGGKKGGGGDGGVPTPPPAPATLPSLNLNGTGSSSSSSSSSSEIVYYDKPASNNNGSLGNPAVIDSPSTPVNTGSVTVAQATPSSSFGSGQSSSSTSSDSGRVVSGNSGSPATSSTTGSNGSLSTGGGTSESGSQSGSVTDSSGKSLSSSGGPSFGGMDGSGSGGSANSGNSADGALISGVPVNKNDTKKSLLKSSLKKTQKVEATNSEAKNSARKISSYNARRSVTKQAPQKQTPESVRDSLRRRGIVK